jgi:tetratricopeptide (TPR) repeat protein
MGIQLWLQGAPEEVRELFARATRLREEGARLGREGRQVEALVALRESVQGLRPLARRFPTIFLPVLGLSLAQWIALLSDPGRKWEVLEALQASAELFSAMNSSSYERQLKHQARFNAVFDQLLQGEATQASPPPEPRAPEAFQPALAESLYHLGRTLYGFHEEEARGILREAEALYRELARRDPAVFVPSLARCLGALSDFHRPEEAVDPAREAAELYRELARDTPGAFLSELASSLQVLVLRLKAVGRSAEAVEPARHVVALYRQLAREDLAAFWGNQLEALYSLGLLLSETGSRDKAVEILREVVALCRDANYQEELARSLYSLGALLGQMGRQAEASEVTREAENIAGCLRAERSTKV